MCYILMMLTQDIKSQMIAAMKAKDQLRVDTLRGAMAAFTNELVAKGRKPTEELTDDEAIAVLKRLGKQRADSIEQYAKGGRPELAEKETSEKRIIEEFLPQMASRDEIEKIAREKMAGMDMSDKAAAGKLIGMVMKEFALAGQAGRADGKMVRDVLARLVG